MFRLYPSEEFREIKFDIRPQYRYAMSNYARLLRFTETFEDGELLTGRRSSGYHVFNYFIKVDGKRIRKSKTFYKIIGELFLEKTAPDQTQVIHLDHDRSNDRASNLKWVTRREMVAHHQNSPNVIQARIIRASKPRQGDGHKLTVTQVMLLKKRLLDPNRKTRIKILAKQFGVSEMQLFRIKRGENWGHIEV